MRNVIVTGASRGLGLATARRLVGDGFCVIAIARRESDSLREQCHAASPANWFSSLSILGKWTGCQASSLPEKKTWRALWARQ